LSTILEALNISKVYESGFIVVKETRALDNVSVKINNEEIVGLVGESGSGKSTLAKILARLVKPTEGKIVFMGRDIWRDLRTHGDMKWFYKNLNIVFQDPYAIFNPYHRVDRVLHLALKLAGIEPDSEEGEKEILNAVRSVGLNPGEVLGRYPHQLSGGQKQRLIIARLYIIKPKLIIADEPVSMIDPSLRAYVLKLLLDLVRSERASMLFITHDIGLAYASTDRILVMYRGKIVEDGTPDEVVGNPKHPYTKRLIESAPRLRG
jgi:peptide/nickel transport system ATP-binding protein